MKYLILALTMLVCVPALAGGSKAPYKWYADLNLNRIPFHKAAGAWGPQTPIIAPEAPVTTRKVTVNTSAELSAAILVAGSEITIGSDIPTNTTAQGNIMDVDIIIPAGRVVGQIQFGGWNPGTTTTRLRIRGPTPGTHSGGRTGTLRFFGQFVSDLIIDGLDIVDSTEEGLWHFAGSNTGVNNNTRIAIVNCRGRAVATGSLGYASHYVVAGNNLISSEWTRAQTKRPEGWGIRSGGQGPVVFFRNRIHGTRYHKIRLHPRHTANEYAWVSENTFFDREEARIFDVFRFDSPDGEKTAAAWFDKNTVYAELIPGGVISTPSCSANHTVYSRVTNNTFYGIFTADLQKAMESASEGTDKDYHTGNTYAIWQDPPAWSGPGDPRELLLPPAPTPSPSP